MKHHVPRNACLSPSNAIGLNSPRPAVIQAALIPAALIASLVVLSACSGIDLGDNPGREVTKQAGPLTTPPEHLKDGQSE